MNWYRQHIEPDHEHVWVAGSTLAELNAFGTVIGVGDGDSRALFRITPVEQIEIFSHISNTAEAKNLFKFVGEDQGTGDQAQRRRIHGAVSTLREWAESGFAEEWAEIKARITAG